MHRGKHLRQVVWGSCTLALVDCVIKMMINPNQEGVKRDKTNTKLVFMKKLLSGINSHKLFHRLCQEKRLPCMQ